MTPAEKLLLAIEDIAANGERIEDSPGQKELRAIFRLCHAHNAPGCMKNHPGWTDELKQTLEAVDKEFLGGRR
jgi:hypothetical protein